LIEQACHSPEVILGDDGLLAQMTKALVERVLGAELAHHLKTGSGTVGGLECAAAAVPANCRNGYAPRPC
jgi:transposase-like protein